MVVRVVGELKKWGGSWSLSSAVSRSCLQAAAVPTPPALDCDYDLNGWQVGRSEQEEDSEGGWKVVGMYKYQTRSK
jgi:hypothetical protein